LSAAVVLVHGAWGGSWCWERVVPLLEERGVHAVAVDLPSVGADGGDPADLSTDARAVAAALDAIDGPKLLCGHSYGGMVVTAAAAGRSDVVRLVYLCAFMPDVGESLFTLTGGRAAPWIDILDDGRSIPNTDYTRAHGYADSDEATREAAIARLRPQVTAPFTGAIEVAAWRSIPSTYVVCSEDASLPPEVQRDVFGARADEVVELVASHQPYFSQPAVVAGLLADRAG
jgi:pimeloyl-ACP methyl ester carboxylesterase